MRLLLVEDDTVLQDGMQRSLQHAGYVVDSACDAQQAENLLAVQEYDLLILDLGLPDRDGLDLLREQRQRGLGTPVLIITARDAVSDRVAGLDLGADDYLGKPFELAEFEARVRALMRRGHGPSSSQLSLGALRVDIKARRVFMQDEELELSAREFGVLEVLLMRRGQVVDKETLVGRLTAWGEELGPNAIEVYVHRLRKKLEDAQVSIRTVRGLGYMLE